MEALIRTTYIPVGLKLYLLLVALLLPLDWFAPTGALFREFGAKPVTLLLTLGGFYGVTLARRERTTRVSPELVLSAIFAAWFVCGSCAALLNFMLGWSGWNFSRSPVAQLIMQSSMLAVAGLALIGNVRLFRGYEVAAYLARVLPIVAAIHLGVFLLNALQIIDDTSFPLALFHVSHMARPTGLFSEPAYFGTFAGLYGMALIYIPGSALRRLFHILLALALFMASILIMAKTFVVVAGAQAAYLVMRKRDNRWRNASGALLFIAIAGCAVFFVQTRGALDVESNLSSAMRLGSNLLAANVAAQGYALSGIGLGQFHFFYRGEFAPDFLFLSSEALDQLSPDATNRASTFNLYIRILVETGIAGFVLLMACLRRLWFARIPDSMVFVSVMFAGALGFLMTQDTYFYPPLVFSSALLISILESGWITQAESGGIAPYAMADA